MCLSEVILKGIVLVYGCIGVRKQVKVYSYTDPPIHLYIGTLHSCTTYGYMIYYNVSAMYQLSAISVIYTVNVVSPEDVPIRGNTKEY